MPRLTVAPSLTVASTKLLTGEDPLRTAHPAPNHILTVNCEDYFQGAAFAKAIDRGKWSRFESRLDKSSAALLERLQAANAAATFFVNTWIAERRPDLILAWLKSGHEIALSGERGRSFRNLDPDGFRAQLIRDRAVLEDVTGRRVLGYRLSDPFLRPSDLWAFEILAEQGFAYDSSLSPLGRRFARQPWRCTAHWDSAAGSGLWVIPLTSVSIAGFMLPLAGGNYFRQYPGWLVRAVLRHQIKQQPPLALYVRLWDFDPDQPRMQSGSMVGNIRHYRNGEQVVQTLSYLFENYRFQSIAEHLGVAPSRTTQGSYIPARTEPMPVEVKDSRVVISIIIPCFNEEFSIGYLAETLRELRTRFKSRFKIQSILVDDGSSDKTWKVINQYFGDDPDFLLLRHNTNQGVSAAIFSGLAHSHEIACSMDCDCTYDPHQLAAMIDLLGPDVDLVTASPYHPQGSVHNVPSWRLLLSRTASAAYRCATGSSLRTFTSCLRVYRRSAVIGQQRRHPGFLGIAELAARLALDQSRIVEFPAVLESRIFGQSKMKMIRTIVGHLGLLSHLASYRLLRAVRRRIGLRQTDQGRVQLSQAIRESSTPASKDCRVP